MGLRRFFDNYQAVKTYQHNVLDWTGMNKSAKLTSVAAVAIVNDETPKAIAAINNFTYTAFRTRGGRLGSGMGSLLEALWVYFINTALFNEGGEARGCEVAWLEDHEPNDFACVHRDAKWTPGTKEGELFRVEAKSMNASGVDESKAHFTELEKRIDAHDQLLVLTWNWEKVDDWRVYPKVIDYLLCPSQPIAVLRDALHIARGGTFVKSGFCPDSCPGSSCKHIGEPINAAGVRERVDGPNSAKGVNVSAANNFGGLVRMLKTDDDNARSIFRTLRRQNQTAHDFISFIHKNFSDEEANQYKLDEWKQVALAGGISKTDVRKLNKDPLIKLVRSSILNYRDLLRDSL